MRALPAREAAARPVEQRARLIAQDDLPLVGTVGEVCGRQPLNRGAVPGDGALALHDFGGRAAGRARGVRAAQGRLQPQALRRIADALGDADAGGPGGVSRRLDRHQRLVAADEEHRADERDGRGGGQRRKLRRVQRDLDRGGVGADGHLDGAGGGGDGDGLAALGARGQAALRDRACECEAGGRLRVGPDVARRLAEAGDEGHEQAVGGGAEELGDLAAEGDEAVLEDALLGLLGEQRPRRAGVGGRDIHAQLRALPADGGG